jgi:hypothetical protein
MTAAVTLAFGVDKDPAGLRLGAEGHHAELRALQIAATDLSAHRSGYRDQTGQDEDDQGKTQTSFHLGLPSGRVSPPVSLLVPRTPGIESHRQPL